MYKVAADRRQASLHRGRPSDWVNGVERLSLQEQLEQMQQGVKIIEARILKTSGEERTALGLQKFQMQNEIREFRKSVNLEKSALRGIDQTFMDMAKEMLPRLQFDLIFRAAKRELELVKSRLEQVATE